MHLRGFAERVRDVRSLRGSAVPESDGRTLRTGRDVPGGLCALPEWRRSGRAHWRDRSDGAVRTASGDQCTHPRRNEVRSAHSRPRRKAECAHPRRNEIRSAHSWQRREVRVRTCDLLDMDTYRWPSGTFPVLQAKPSCAYRTGKVRGPVPRCLSPRVKSTHAESRRALSFKQMWKNIL